MTDINELLKLIPVDDIANQLGVDKQTAQQGIQAALPTLIGGLQANAADPAGAKSLEHALEKKDTSLVEGRVSLADIDTNDGEKIVKNVFGSNTDQVAAALGSAPGGQTSGLVQKLLPILAPIVLAWLAKKFLGGQQGASTTAGSGSGGGLEDLLGGILGGGSGSSAGSANAGGGAGGGLGDILGQVLGGASGSGKPAGGGLGGGLGDILGGLLGGGKR
ncbi:DUF937 domain-containing protein [Pseudoclavibacter sp. RFBB5]|uniref:DUF937 domain-containing protein n=1 Tax=Pseudoclavibacter sp. RFBB5 TaxID=2080574 RepID=UPI000CE753C2|nr:DUF937 domain-containing protein [Pseudoclavibacter sp. RFBB5]PPG27025.1 hypothetical protein C5B97_16450 [Pseudoclavibacter sp. RFBB5]